MSSGCAGSSTGGPAWWNARGTNGNDLLGMAAATGDERLVRAVLERGADPSSANAHGWTPLHQAGYSAAPLARMLLDAGAPADVVSARGRRHAARGRALLGPATTAELLAERGSTRATSVSRPGSAGSTATLLGGGGTPAAGAHRGFYRPHSGFPA